MNLLRSSLLVTFLGMAACSSTSGDRDLDIRLPSVPVRVGDQVTVSALPQGELAQAPEWEVEEVQGGGFLNPRGLEVTYVAPELAGRYHLVARARRLDGTAIKEVAEVPVLPRSSIEPAQASVAPGGRLVFTARMKGLPRNTVTWSLEEPGGGRITGEGVYEASDRRGTYHVRAASTLDPEAVATAVVTVE